MKPYRIFALPLMLLLLILISGCPPSGGGSGDSNCPNDVSGAYTFTTNDIQGSCSDGSGGTSPPISMRFQVVQDDNWITLYGLGGGSSVGLEVISNSDMDGALESDCDFVTNLRAVVAIEGISGNVTVNYTIDGTFTDNGWHGDYDYSAFFQSYGETCRYSTVFSGSKSSSNLYNTQESDELILDAFGSNENISVEELVGRFIGN